MILILMNGLREMKERLYAVFRALMSKNEENSDVLIDFPFAVVGGRQVRQPCQNDYYDTSSDSGIKLILSLCVFLEKVRLYNDTVTTGLTCSSPVSTSCAARSHVRHQERIPRPSSGAGS